MANNEAETGLELVLDNRKLIVAFALLIAFCGCFFVVGFIEGKRQGFQEGNQTAAETVPKPVPEPVVQIPADKPAAPEAKAQSQEPDQPTDWYKSIHEETKPPAANPSASAPVSKTPAPETAAVKTEKPKPPASTEPASYSVQVGAFSHVDQLKIREQLLREKGYDCRMEAPSEPGQLYLLKVGKFRTRAEAAAVQQKLKRQGFSSFIKAN